MAALEKRRQELTRKEKGMQEAESMALRGIYAKEAERSGTHAPIPASDILCGGVR